MNTSVNPNDLTAVIEADRAHLWHHLIHHKQFETNDPRIMVEGKGMRVWDATEIGRASCRERVFRVV